MSILVASWYFFFWNFITMRASHYWNPKPYSLSHFFYKDSLSHLNQSNPELELPQWRSFWIRIWVGGNCNYSSTSSLLYPMVAAPCIDFSTNPKDIWFGIIIFLFPCLIWYLSTDLLGNHEGLLVWGHSNLMGLLGFGQGAAPHFQANVAIFPLLANFLVCMTFLNYWQLWSELFFLSFFKGWTIHKMAPLFFNSD